VEIPATTTRILLNHFKWGKKLMERFHDGDQNQLFSEARVINPFRKPPVVNRPKVKPPRTSAADTEEYEICFMVLLSSMMTGLQCGHRFCTQYWGEYFATKIVEEGVG
jgi:ariadne-1